MKSALILIFFSLPAFATPRDCERARHVRALLVEQSLDTRGVDALLPRVCQRVSRAVELHSSDTCSLRPLATVGPRTSCAALAERRAVWGIKVRGKCMDVEDMPFGEACERFKRVGPRAMKIFKSDYCGSRMVAVVGQRTSCAELPAAGTDAWAVSVEGRCVNVRDTSLRDACERYRYVR